MHFEKAAVELLGPDRETKADSPDLDKHLHLGRGLIAFHLEPAITNYYWECSSGGGINCSQMSTLFGQLMPRKLNTK